MRSTAKFALTAVAAASLGLAAAVIAAPGDAAPRGYGPGPCAQGQVEPGTACMGPMGCGYGPGPNANAPRQSYGPGPGMGMGRFGGGPGYGPAGRAARLDALKGELNLGADQQAAWQTYADTVRAASDARVAMHDSLRDKMRSGSATPEEIATWRDSMHATNVQAATDIAKAREALYAVLSPEQKATADRYLVPQQFGRRGGWGRAN